MSQSVAVWHGVNLASERLGAKALYANDDFFAPKERMLQDSDPVFIAGKYDENGKWMDGWETRRKREQGYDYCVVQLAVSGRINKVEIDTRHFTGNYAPAAMLEACRCSSMPTEETQWTAITDTVALEGNSQKWVDIASNEVYTHVRLNIYPDGGVARLRVYGQPEVEWQGLEGQAVDLFAMAVGGHAIEANDEHFGSKHNLNLPGRGINMGDGWETRRRREPGNDWVILALGHRGEIDEVIIDTAYFKGNFADACSIQVADVGALPETTLAAQSLYWQELLPKSKLGADQEHRFREALAKVGPITHLRVNIFPDGGISRIRVIGKPVF
ncbi:allantoicase [Marinomonas pollencensis]|uniref:Probable allantoicase n=1 Tax=Marinomonas pollencensis TaxID=491954 RepID=A0A3E0DJ13_9GAMM|nr:allantoicase [Marinomonas pollencensis]REG81812.1 allantoicase [Marinomonas pollencensis]